MALDNLFIRVKRFIGNIRLDGVLSETHSNSVRATKNPVELGADITDHALVEPIKIVIEGVVSDTPLGVQAGTQLFNSVTGLFGSSVSSSITRSQQAYSSLVVLMNELEPIDIQTGLKLYENMLLTNIDITQDKDKSRAAFLTISAEEIIIPVTEVIPLSSDNLEAGNTTSQAQSNANRGRQEPEVLDDDSTIKKSAAKSLVDWFN